MTPDGFPIVGIVGAGQLARMMVQAAIPLGIEVRVLAERPTDSAALVCPHVDIGHPDSAQDLHDFAERVDIVTLDHELVNDEALERIEASGGLVRPGAATLRYAKDKLHQRRGFAAAGLPVPAFAEVQGAGDIERFSEEHGWPVVAKAQRGGYDGRGVWILDDREAARSLVQETQEAGVDLLVERFVPLHQELAVLVARRPSGESVVYPVVETVQQDGICHEVIAPAPVDPAVAAQAVEIGRAVAEHTGAAGIVATELFLSDDGEVLINEIATRPHNSGHVTMNACQTSQFENHLRAVLDWQLGPTDLLVPTAVMANLLGADREPLGPRVGLALSSGPVNAHLYGKEVRPGRKVGHVNALGDDLGETRQRAALAAAIITGRAPAGGRHE